MKIRIVKGFVLGAAIMFLGLSVQTTQGLQRQAMPSDAVNAVSQRNPVQVDLHGRGEKLPVLAKCGKRFGHIFSYCYSQQYFATLRIADRPKSQTA